MTRREQAAASRSELLRAARECFTEHGYEGATVADILRRAGMARGALYHYFPGGKREIFAAVFNMMNNSFHEQRDALLTLPSPLDRLRAGVSIFLELCTDDDFARIVLSDAPQVVPGQTWRGSSFSLLRQQLLEAVAAGEIERFINVEVSAMALYGAVRSAGEFVTGAHNRPAAVLAAADTVNRFIEGMRGTP